MGKVVLVFDEPECCACCPCLNDFYKRCNKEARFITEENIYEQKPNWCSLKEVPEKIGVEEALKMPRNGNLVDVINSYNACIDEILGGGE